MDVLDPMEIQFFLQYANLSDLSHPTDIKCNISEYHKVMVILGVWPLLECYTSINI